MNPAFSKYWRDLASGKRAETADRILILFLAPFAWLYSSLQRLRVVLYRTRILKTQHLPRPVVSIGNITVGGTGKTPFTAYIARLLLERGHRVAVLSRGYGGSLEGQTCVVSDGATIMMSAKECGDEPYLLASSLPGLIVIIGTDRYAAGMLAIQQLSPDIFLLDDGFQHLRLSRDLNFLLLDFRRPFGNDLTLPAGILREPSAAALRADYVIFTRTPQGATLNSDSAGIPCSISHHTIINMIPLEGGQPVSFSDFTRIKVLAFAGIADSDSFFEELREKGLNIVHTICFSDHAAYTRADMDLVMESFEKYGAGIAITTEKDGVKLKGFWHGKTGVIMLARLELVIDDPAKLSQVLFNLLQK